MGTKCRFSCDIMAQHEGVTGSSILVITKLPDGEKIKFIVDFGLFQEEEYWKHNSEILFDPATIDFCLITHNHVDHIGRLPLLVRNGYRNPIYTTYLTKGLLQYSLIDSYKVLKDTAKRKNEKCLYSEMDVQKTNLLVEDVAYEETFKVHDHIKVTFFKNGHLLGAALILVQIRDPGYEDINILFTGDYNSQNLFFKVPSLPKWVLKLPLTIIQESTYGTRESTEIVASFKENVIKVLENEKTVVIPVFSLGRAQEILYILKSMQDNKEISKHIPIYLDGNLAIKYTEFYKREKVGSDFNRENFIPENFAYVTDDSRYRLIESEDVKVIVTTSGMGSYGPAQQYIPQFLRKEGCLIQFTGYVAEGTLGRRLKDATRDETVSVSGLIVRKKANVDFTTEYSAHAKADEMIAFLQNFKNLKLVLVNHGEPSVKTKFAERIMDEVEPKDVGILGRDYFFRVGAYGLVKTLGTKFV